MNNEYCGRRKKEEGGRTIKRRKKKEKKTKNKKHIKTKKPEENPSKTEQSTKTVRGRTHQNPRRRTHVWMVPFILHIWWAAPKPLEKSCFQGKSRRTPQNAQFIKSPKNPRRGLSKYPWFLLVTMRGLETLFLSCFLMEKEMGFNHAPSIRNRKRLTKQKNCTNSTKEFSEKFEGLIGSLPNKTRVLRQITPESSPERSAKSLSHSFFVVPFLSPTQTASNGVQLRTRKRRRHIL